MKRAVTILLLGLLVACGPTGAPTAVPEESTAGSVESDTQQAEPTADEPEPVAEVDEVDGSDLVSDSDPAAADVSSDTALPAKTPAEAGVIRDSDHVLGASDPVVTIIEYGDFQ